MKIKVIDEIDKIKLTLTHKELIVLKEALQSHIFDGKNQTIRDLNDQLWDKDEIEVVSELNVVRDKMLLKIRNILSNIITW